VAKSNLLLDPQLTSASTWQHRPIIAAMWNEQVCNL